MADLYKHAMEVLSFSEGDESASITLGYVFDGTDPGYPFKLAVNITYMLGRDASCSSKCPSTFTCTTSVRNDMRDGSPLPFFNGWHSYFKVKDISKAVGRLRARPPPFAAHPSR